MGGWLTILVQLWRSVMSVAFILSVEPTVFYDSTPGIPRVLIEYTGVGSNVITEEKFSSPWSYLKVL